MASVSASVNCCVCKTHVSAGNRRVLNGPREVESNKKVVDFLNKYCCKPLNAPDVPSFICKSCFSTVQKAHKHVQSAKLTIDSLRQSLDLPLAQLELNSTVEPPAATPLREAMPLCPGAPGVSVPIQSNLNEPIVEREDRNGTPRPPLKKPRRRLLAPSSHASCCSGSNIRWWLGIMILLCCLICFIRVYLADDCKQICKKCNSL